MEGEFSLTVQTLVKCKLGGEGRPHACSILEKKLFVLRIMAILFSYSSPVWKFNLPNMDRGGAMRTVSLLT